MKICFFFKTDKVYYKKNSIFEALINLIKLKMKKKLLKVLFIVLLIIVPVAISYSQPPPPGGGADPSCWPPPCVPIDGAILWLFLAGLAYGAKKIFDLNKKA